MVQVMPHVLVINPNGPVACTVGIDAAVAMNVSTEALLDAGAAREGLCSAARACGAAGAGAVVLGWRHCPCWAPALQLNSKPR